MWLLAANIREAIENAYKNGVLPTAQQQADYVARYGAYDSATERVLKTAGDVAQINVSGVITSAPDFMAMLFGGGNVTYPEIIAALAEADANPEIARAEMRIDSAGGHVNGLFDTIAAMQQFSKPLRAVVVNQACSAAYALACQTGEIVATNRAARVGSIGIAATFCVDPSIIEIASTAAPNKRPDVSTPEGQAVVREELDALHELFAEAIATGRGTTIDKVNAEYGQGATLLADAALKRGMIDTIAGPGLRVVQSADSTSTASAGGNTTETGRMNLDQLKATHPDVYAAAVKAGEAQERDRVGAHLTMGRASGDMATALAAVADGSPMTSTLQAKYLAAGMNRKDQSNRQVDDAAAGDATNTATAGAGAGGGSDAAAASEQVVALVEQSLGIQKKA